jgi:isopenicillin N synthase-like dioxygenase
MSDNVAMRAVRPAETDEIPVIDVSRFLAGEPGALEACAAQLRHAYEDVGFWFLTGHGISRELIAEVFEEAARFHALPLEEKMRIKIDHHNIGYLPMKAATVRHSDVSSGNKPNLNEALFIKRDLPADHPDVVGGVRFRGAVRWPEGLPGFREKVVEYCEVMERLSLAILPLYAVALDLPPDFFSEAFREPQYNLRLTHYPPTEQLGDGEYGLAPHSDTSFMTLLAPNAVPGLIIQTSAGQWIEAPVVEDAFIVNSGQLLRRWSNDRFRATPHCVANRSGGERYAIPFFFDMTRDFEISCLPSCQGPGNPAKYPPTTYAEFMAQYQAANYDHAPERQKEASVG